LTSPRDRISDVGKLDELPHRVSKGVVTNLFKLKRGISKNNPILFSNIYPRINPQLMHIIKPIISLRRPRRHNE
jgi:hypothetical protein